MVFASRITVIREDRESFSRDRKGPSVLYLIQYNALC